LVKAALLGKIKDSACSDNPGMLRVSQTQPCYC